MSVLEIRDGRFSEIIGADAAFERLGSGFLFTEGPLWHPRERYLLFSHIPGDQIRKWSAEAGITTFRKPSNMSNGLTWDREGRLLACEHATSRVTLTEPDGRITVIASHYQGKELNSPNDIVVKSDGSIYFSDPTYGRREYYGVPRQPELEFRGVYRVEPGADPILIVEDFDQPNGLCFSLDETVLFINDTSRKHIRAFDANLDGTVANGRIWAETTGEGAGAPDGMKIDSAGNLFCCGPGRIHVFDPRANCLGVIQVPEYVTNFAWGDDDLRSLFVTASTSLYRIRLKVPGRSQPF
jgi:gluconolactonase